MLSRHRRNHGAVLYTGTTMLKTGVLISSELKSSLNYFFLRERSAWDCHHKNANSCYIPGGSIPASVLHYKHYVHINGNRVLFQMRWIFISRLMHSFEDKTLNIRPIYSRSVYNYKSPTKNPTASLISLFYLFSPADLKQPPIWLDQFPQK